MYFGKNSLWYNKIFSISSNIILCKSHTVYMFSFLTCQILLQLRALETHQQASTSSPIGGSDSPANRWTTIADHADSHHSSVGSGASSVGPVGGIASPASSPATANSVSVVHKEEDTSRDGNFNLKILKITFKTQYRFL